MRLRVLGFIFAALAFPPSAGAIQTLRWDLGDTFLRVKTFALNDEIRADRVEFDLVTQCAADGVPDDPESFPETQAHVVRSRTVELGDTIPTVSSRSLSGPLVNGNPVGRDVLVTLGRARPRGSLEPGTYAVVLDECQDGRLDPEDALLDPAFRIEPPWATFGRDAARASRTPVRGPIEPDVRWSLQKDGSPGTPQCCSTSSPAIGTDGTVYVGTNGGDLLAVDPQTGSLRWRFSTSGWIDASPALGPDGTVYFGNREPAVYALNPDGSQLWWRATDGLVSAGPVIDAERGTLYVGTIFGEGSSLYALSLTSGELFWRIDAPEGIWRPPTLGPDGTIYFSDTFGFVLAVNPDGSEKWRTLLWSSGSETNATCPGPAGRPVGISAPVWSPRGGEAGTLYVGASYVCSGDRDKSHGHLVALAPEDGTVRWEYPADHETGAQLWSAPALGPDGAIHVGAGLRDSLGAPVSWFLVSLSPSGALVDRYAMPAPVSFWGGPSVGGDGTVYVGSGTGTVHGFRGGRTLWTLQTLGDDIQTKPALGLDGTLYVASHDGRLYAIEAAEHLELRALEVTQAVQNWRHDVLPLVAGKRTYVRAHLEASGTDGQSVKGCLRGFDADGELADSPLEPQNSSGTIHLDPQEFATEPARRAFLPATLYFRLPASWTHGDVTFRLERQRPERSCAELVTDPLPPEELPALACREPAEPGGTPDDCTVEVSFVPTEPFEVRFVKLSWVDGADVKHAATDADALTEATRVVSRFPIAGLPATVNAGQQFFIGETGFNGIPADDHVFRELERLRAHDGCGVGCSTHYYGIFPDNYFDFTGIAYRPGKLGFGRPTPSHRPSTQSHELAHNLGIAHSVHRQFGVDADGNLLGPCGSTGSPAVEDFPYIHTLGGSPIATIGPLDEGPERLVYGLDTAPPRGGDARVIDPFDASALMSYCRSPRWPSLANYLRLRLLINQLDEAAGLVPLIAAEEEFLLIHGQIDLDTDAAELLPFGRLTTASPPPLPPAGDYRLELRDEAGGVIEVVAIEPQVPLQPEVPPDARVGSFLVARPFDPSVREVALLRGAVLLSSRTAGPTPPSVQVMFPNGGEVLSGASVELRWSASDADGDALTYVVQFSPDDGATWETLATNWSETALEVPLASLTGTAFGRLRVRAQDGFHTGVDVSDDVFRVPDGAPLLTLRSPESERLFVGEQQIVLEALAFDREDGALAAADLAWRSDVDGALGTGAELRVVASTLSEGDHVVTVTATDSGGAAVEASVPIRVARTVADLTLTLTDAPDPAAPGATVAYMLTVTNHGPQTATGVVVTDEPSAGFVFADLSATIALGCAISAVDVACDVGTLEPGASVGITLEFTTQTAGVFENRARVEAAQTDPEPDDNARTATTVVDVDSDGDGLVDLLDNCIERANGPRLPDAGGASQRDDDGDGFGDVCDPDLDQSGLVDAGDLALLKAAFFGGHPQADLSGEGSVEFLDLALLKARFEAAPGPSGVAP